MSLYLLTAAEKNPTVVFEEAALSLPEKEELLSWRQLGLVRRVELPAVVRSEVRYDVHRVDAALLGVSHEGEDSEVLTLNESDLDGWQIEYPALAAYLHRMNGLDGQVECLSARLIYLGAGPQDQAVLLGLFAGRSQMEQELLSVPSRLPGSITSYRLACPSFVCPEQLKRQLDGLHIVVSRLEDDNPFRITMDADVLFADDGFSFSDGYRSAFLRGMPPFILTPRQAAVVEMLHSAYRAKRPEMAWKEIKARLETMGTSFHADSMQDIFKRVPDWKKLIVSTRRGFYKLGI